MLPVRARSSAPQNNEGFTLLRRRETLIVLYTPDMQILICGTMLTFMTQIRISDAAKLLGVSDDTVRRWITSGSLDATKDSAGRKVIDGSALATFAHDQNQHAPETPGASSARNRFVGLVTAVKADSVMAQVDMQCGPFRVVSLMSAESVRDLQLEPGSIAVAVIKSTTVIVEALEGTP